MNRQVNTTEIQSDGADLAENEIQIYAVDRTANKLMHPRFSRTKTLELFQSLKSCENGIEACGVRISGCERLTQWATRSR